MNELTENNLTLYAAQNYTNTNCLDPQEFEEDLNRIVYIKKLLKKYIDSGVIRERLLLNHFIILYNVFDHYAMTKILLFKLPEYHAQLKSFLSFLNYWPEIINLNNNIIKSSDIKEDTIIIQRLKEI
jgi:hypothetical protein